MLTCVTFAANSEEALEQWRRKLAEAEEVMTGMEAMMTATEEENRRLQVANYVGRLNRPTQGVKKRCRLSWLTSYMSPNGGGGRGELRSLSQ
jgi:hypothetical protein